MAPQVFFTVKLYNNYYSSTCFRSDFAVGASERGGLGV
jgi:hypothetical protein